MINNNPKLIKRYLIVIEDLVAQIVDSQSKSEFIYSELHYNLQILLMDFQENQEQKLADYHYTFEVKKLLIPCYKYLRDYDSKSELEKQLYNNLVDLFEVLN